jgi:dTDP-4-dehydrorhamnose 3,5-epimerase
MNPVDSDAVRKDRQTVSAQGDSLTRLPEGMSFRNVPTHVDDRGIVFEMFDMRWNWHPDPVVFSYCYTVRPGIIKGWGVHRKHEDRYFLLFGELELILYDERPDSSTHGLVSKIYLNHYQRRIINIPAGVWHANRNVGLTDAVVVNFPTIPYDHADPDKYRLPLDTDKIPYKFKSPRGW